MGSPMDTDDAQDKTTVPLDEEDFISADSKSFSVFFFFKVV